MTGPEPALHGPARLTVIVAGTSVAVRCAGRILAAWGVAEVWAAGPVPERPDADTALDRWLDEGKRYAADGAMPAPDLIIADADAETDGLATAAPGAVVTLAGTTPEMAVSDLLLSARSGAALPTGAAGREPLYGIGHRLQYGIAHYLVIAALAALSAARAEGRRVEARVDARGVALGFVDQHAAAAAYSGARYRRNGTAGTHKHPSRIYGRGENAVIVYCVRDEEWFRLADMVGLSQRPEFAHLKTEGERLEHAALIDAHIEAWFAGRDYREIMELARAHRVPMAPACPPELALELAREFIDPKERARAQGAWLHDGEEGLAAPAVNRLRLADIRGMRVVEMSTGWSMPLVGRILAHLGAEVIKIESSLHFDSWRGSKDVSAGLHRYPDGLPPSDPLNMNAAFNIENVGKRSALLNLKHPQARDAALRLFAKAGCFIENHRPGALARRGLDRTSIRAVSPGIGFLSISACGKGAGSDLVGWGPTIEAIGGMTALLGYEDTQNLNTGYAIVDPLTGLQSLSALLIEGLRTQGAAVDLSMLQATIDAMPEPFLDARWKARLVNGHPDMAPHGIYPVAGEDAWIALLCRSDDQWRRLAAMLGLGATLALEGLGEAAARVTRRGEIDAAVAAATRTCDPGRLAADLAAAGIPACVLSAANEVMGDPAALADGIVVGVDHPSAGPRLQPSIPIGAGWDIAMARGYAPRLGEDTEYVWREIAGLGRDDYLELREAGVFK